MNRKELIEKAKTAFSVKELVCDHTYAKFGDNSWQVLKTELIATLVALRFDIFKRPMIINSYASGYTQRGNRCNMCKLVKDKTLKGVVYLSAHIFGAAFDISIKGLSGEDMRQMIISSSDKLPCNIRMEGGVSWLHIDVNNTPYGQKIYIFKA